MDRRNFIAANLTAALGLGVAKNQKSATGKGSPNIIVIVGDDLGWKELGCYGNSHVNTPGMDRLAKEGVKFTNAFVAAPSCSPSRAASITGKTPHSIGVFGLTHVNPEFSLSPKVETFPRLLKDHGYSTAIQGKWHESVKNLPGSFGYGRFIIDLKGGPASIMKVPDAKKPCEFIKKHKDRPFYLELNFTQTHRMVEDPKSKAFSQNPRFPVDPEKIKVPEYWALPDWPEIRKDAAGYWSQVMAMDAIVGEVLNCLDENQIADNTLVILWGDNGAPFPGMKMCLYDRGAGTPLLMRWPGRFSAGLVRNELASINDLAPTVLESAGVEIPADFQGRSLVALGEGKDLQWRDAVFTEMSWHVYFQPMRAVRTDKWKLIWNLSKDPVNLDQCIDFEWAQKAIELPWMSAYRERTPIELYDIVSDPNEKQNLAEGKNIEQAEQDPKYGAIVRELMARLKEWRAQTKDIDPKPKGA